MATKTPRLKLLFFSPYFHPYISGLTQYPYRLFTESELPLDVTCLTFKHENNLKSRDVINHVSTKTTILRMPFWFRISKGFISPQSLTYFWKEINKNDALLLNLPSIEGIFLALFAKLRSKPLISLLHCEVLLPFSFLNVFVNFILNCGVCIQLALSDTILIYTKDYYEKKYVYSFFKKKMKIVLPPVHSNPPDVVYLSSLKMTTGEYSRVVGFCGRIAAEKGIEVLIDAISQINNTLLLIAGPAGKDVVGENYYFQKVESLLAERHIPHIFLGTLSGGKLSAFYKVIDVLALPSLNKTEAFGMVQVEAMLQGTPVIASNLPGVRVPIHKTNMGKIIEIGNVTELKNAITAICKDKNTYSNPHLIHKAQTLFDSRKTYDSIYSILCKN